MEGMVATTPALAYIKGTSVDGLFFRNHMSDPSAASDNVNT